MASDKMRVAGIKVPRVSLLWKYRAVSSTGEVLEGFELSAILRIISEQMDWTGAPSWTLEKVHIHAR